MSADRGRLQSYLQSATAADAKVHDVVSSLVGSGEDDDVDMLFRAYAKGAVAQRLQLQQQLKGLVGGAENTESEIAAPVSYSLGFRTSIPEERVAESLLTAFAAVNGSRAIYRILAILSSEAGDSEMERIARDIEAHRNRIAGEIWHLIPTRVKIAFNVLTAGETDPTVSTRTSQNSLV